MITLQCTREMLERALADEPFEGIERWALQDALTAQDQAERIDALETALLISLTNVRTLKAANPGLKIYDGWEQMLAETLHAKAPVRAGA